MKSRWQGWFAAATVTLVAGVLVILDVTDAGLRRWWDAHALTTSTVSGLLVLLITALVVDQVVRLREVSARSRAVAVQAAIIVGQAHRTWQAASQALTGSGDREAAYDEFRTYTTMLLAAAPVLIDGRTARTFLEQAQHLDGEMALALSVLSRKPTQADSWNTRLYDAVEALKAASAPLLASLDPDMRAAVRGDDPA